MMKQLIQLPIRGYQKWISPLFPPSCRYQPSCSTYMYEAVEEHGTVKGLLMGISRVLRCHPMAHGGYDPVPDHFTLKRQYRRHHRK